MGTIQELPPFPWHTLATDLFYWKRMDFLIVEDVFSKYILVRKLPNSTSAAVCIELSMIVTELGLPHIIRSDNGPCCNSKEFQQFLEHYSITHQTSSPNHPRSNGFIEKQITRGFTSQLFLMGTETLRSRILMNILHPVVSHHH